MALARMEHTGDAPATGVASPIASGDGTFTVLNGTGYPTGAVGNFVICLDPGAAAEEKVLCSARSGTTFTVAGSGRGYDGTSAQSHAVGTTNVQHVLAAIEVDDDNDHLYTTTRDDHSQYARTDGTRAITGTQHFSNQIVVASGSTITSGGETITAGGLTVTAGGLSVAAGTTAVQALTATTITGTGALGGVTTITGTGEVKGTDFNATGLTGATAGTRLVGATTAASPASGTFVTGDMLVDQSGYVWVCTSGGTSGTWKLANQPPALTRVHCAATNFSTASTTAVELDATLEVTTNIGQSGMADILIVLSGVSAASASTFDVTVYTQVDSAGYVVCGANSFTAGLQTVTVTGRYRYTGLSVGSHTFYVGWSQAGGTTLTLNASTRAGMQIGSYHVVQPL